MAEATSGTPPVRRLRTRSVGRGETSSRGSRRVKTILEANGGLGSHTQKERGTATAPRRRKIHAAASIPSLPSGDGSGGNSPTSPRSDGGDKRVATAKISGFGDFHGAHGVERQGSNRSGDRSAGAERFGSDGGDRTADRYAVAELFCERGSDGGEGRSSGRKARFSRLGDGRGDHGTADPHGGRGGDRDAGRKESNPEPKDEVARLQKTISSMEKNARESASQRQRLLQENKKLTKALQEQTTKEKSKCDGWKEHAAKLKERLVSVQTRVADLDKVVASQESDAKKMRSNLEQKHNELRLVRGDVQRLQRAVDKARKEVERITMERDEARKELARLKKVPKHSDNTAVPENVPIFVGQSKTPAKVVIGIDLGESSSGISILYTDIPETVHCIAPGAQSGETKVPTVLFRGRGGEWAFGHEAVEKYMAALEDCEDHNATPIETARRLRISLFRHFYTIERKGKTLRQLESATAESITGAKHRLMELVTQTLVILADFAMAELRRSWGNMLDLRVDNTIQWVLSVPASWNNRHKMFLRMAALKAGLINVVESGCLHLVSHPDAASLAINCDAPHLRLFDQGASFMVLDCGGETVDITTHRIESQEPLVIKTITPVRSGSWGATSVDNAFQSFLEDFIGMEKMNASNNKFPFVVERIMKEFRRMKESFDPQLKDAWYIISISELLDADENNLLDRALAFNAVTAYTPFNLQNKAVKKNLMNGKLRFSPDQMTDFFGPSKKEIITMVREELEKCDDLKHIIVVGGFGSNKAVASSLQKAFSDQNVVVSDRPQAACAKGAALLGLYTPQCLHPIPEDGNDDETENDQLGEEEKKLKEDLEKLRQERKKWESSREEDKERFTNLERALAKSQSENQKLGDTLLILQVELEKKDGSQKANSGDEKVRALRMLEGAIVKRQDAPRRTTSPSFPTGPEISKVAVGLQYAAADFLHGLRDELVEWGWYRGPTDSVPSYRVVFDKILMKSWDMATRFVAEFEHFKLTALSSFLGDTSVGVEEMERRVQTENTALSYFWKYSMQETVKQLSRNKGHMLEGQMENMLATLPLLDDDNADDDVVNSHKELMEWACSPETSQALEELDSPNWHSFTEDLILLSLYCKYSDPPCYLWPEMGAEVAYSQENFKLEKISGCRKKPKAGDFVRVLLPGLFFVDPRTDPTIEATSKALVMAFP